MSRCITAACTTVALLCLWSPAAGAAAAAAVTTSSGAARNCPDSHVLVAKAPLLTDGGQRLGVGMLFAGESTQVEPPAPGFCFEVSVKKRFRKLFAPLRKKLTVTSPATNTPNVVGTTEPAGRQFPLASYASYLGPGCTARATVVIKVGDKRATAVVKGAL